jgi:hypothetical protein
MNFRAFRASVAEKLRPFENFKKRKPFFTPKGQAPRRKEARIALFFA